MSQKLFPFAKSTEKHGGVPKHYKCYYIFEVKYALIELISRFEEKNSYILK